MSARLRRLTADYNKVKYDFAGHPHITVEPISGNPPERYRITYRLNGYKLDAITKQPVISNFHQAEVYLHEEYPSKRPYCTIHTPIYHPNFKNGMICIGDHWSAAKTLSEVIITIGDMIQYKSHNPGSALDIDAANWAVRNPNLFPVGNADLWQPEIYIE